MRSHKVDIGLRNSAHSDLIEGTSEERSKGGAEHDIPVPAGQSDTNADEILLGNEALHVTVVEGFLVSQRESRVLGVTIQGNDTLTRLA